MKNSKNKKMILFDLLVFVISIIADVTIIYTEELFPWYRGIVYGGVMFPFIAIIVTMGVWIIFNLFD